MFMLLSLITSLFIHKWRYFNLKRMQYTYRESKYREQNTHSILLILLDTNITVIH